MATLRSKKNISSKQKKQLAKASNSGDCRVSIIIPAYNHSHYIGDAINSALAQSYDNYEIIVVNDGSQDNTREVVAQFGTQVCYIWQANQGLSAARNTGINAAQGEFIALLDADDLFEPDFIQTSLSILESRPEADAIYCKAQTVDENNRPLPQQIGRAVAPDNFYKTLIRGGFFPPSCMFAYKYCYDQLDQLFDPTLRACEDWDMWLRFSERYSVMGTEKVLLRYRITPQSMSSDPIRMMKNRLVVLQKHFGYSDIDETQWSASQEKAYGFCHITTAIEYLQLNDLERCSYYLNKAFQLCPDLSLEYDVFYNLSYGTQPKGWRGDFATLDVQKSAALVVALLEKAFADSEISEKLNGYKHKIYANAYKALAMQFYGKHQFMKARRYFLSAISVNPRCSLEWEVVTKLMKSFMPIQLVAWLKKKRQVFKI